MQSAPASIEYINADCVYEGEHIIKDRITGDLSFTGEAKSDKIVGYFAYFETVNGFKKGLCWTRDEVIAHAKKFSKSYGSYASAWKTHFDAMALKTMLRNLISKYGIMSVDMTKAVDSDRDYDEEYAEHANTGPIIDLPNIPSESPTNGASVKDEQEGPPYQQSDEQMPTHPGF